MGQCVSLVQRVNKTKETYKVIDQLYDINEQQALNRLITERRFSLDHLKNSIQNEVKYHFVTPKIYVPGIDNITKEILQLMTTKLGIQVISFTTYNEVDSIKDSLRSRNVLIHLVQNSEDIKKLETPLFDVFVCLNINDCSEEIKQQYLIEQIQQYAIMTKSAQYQEQQINKESNSD